MISFILQGEKYVDNYTSNPHNLKILHNHGDTLCKYLDLFSCDLQDAPERYDSHSMCSIRAFLISKLLKETNSNIPAIEHIGIISVDFKNVDLSQFEKKKVEGIETTVLQYSIKVIFGAEEGVLKFLVTAKDAVIGNVNIDFSQKPTISQMHAPRSRKTRKSIVQNSPT